ncbi:hypothetical protein N7462_000921 [Penicillium macrosclerotiorum]|uniref:uncharacterized protein n=1 Tax=Penicillium macrosclerotiorum TaxID=303699 RepID=UPI0025498E43|nr:uncharacterized protein N7462_000921 [Penicillium macrosclerotiorum]KAJ5698916.1 hypothetical protein N7462_000921 [Penicillium macrosclerotiorum]
MARITAQKRKRATSRQSVPKKKAAPSAKLQPTEAPPSDLSVHLQNGSDDQAGLVLQSPRLKTPSLNPQISPAHSHDESPANLNSPSISLSAEGDSGISLPIDDQDTLSPKENDTGVFSTESSVLINVSKEDSQVPGGASYSNLANPSQSKDAATFIELPHNLGPITVPQAGNSTIPTESPVQGSQASKEHISHEEAADIHPSIYAADTHKTGDLTPNKKLIKKNTYGLTPGNTPFPNHKHPTPKECKLVNELLSKAHGEVIAPATIPEPSLTVTGCGEVPSVLDALIRTLLSGATTSKNSARAFNGLVQRFGILEDGIGKGSVNWDAVRQASVKDVFEAIKSGGLADIKSKNLKLILDQVYNENQLRKNQHLAEESSTEDEPSKLSSLKGKAAAGIRDYDIASANEHFLNLNYFHKYDTQKAMRKLVQYPGIGPKTAACVVLFCLQRPCFAVDTHIFRICKWLGWVPPKSNEITAFSHLDVKIPDEFKYSLHQLFIKHGKECGRCRAITSPASADWDTICVIESLVKRTGKMKGGAPQALKRRATGAPKVKVALKENNPELVALKAEESSRNKVKKAHATKKTAARHVKTQTKDHSAAVAPLEMQPLLNETQATVMQESETDRPATATASTPLRKPPARKAKSSSSAVGNWKLTQSSHGKKKVEKVKKSNRKAYAPANEAPRKSLRLRLRTNVHGDNVGGNKT